MKKLLLLLAAVLAFSQASYAGGIYGPTNTGLLITTKGSLLTSDGTSTQTLAVGIDGTVPIANTNSTNGFDWFASPSRPKLQSGRFLTPFNAGTNSGVTGTASVLFFAPVYLQTRQTFTALGFAMSGASTAISIIMGVYADNGGIPGLLVSGSSVTGGPYTDVGDTSHTINFTAPVTFNPGWYWVGIQPSGSQAIKGVGSVIPGWILGCPDLLTQAVRPQISNTFGSGLPANGAATTFTSGNAYPFIGMLAQ